MHRAVQSALWIWLLLAIWNPHRRGADAAEESDTCSQYDALYPTIYDQLLPFLGGITQHQVDLAAKTMVHFFAGYEPQRPLSTYNFTAAQTLTPEDPNFPWSHPFFVKIVIKDGEVYLPGGRLPSNTHGFSFAHNWYSGHLLLDLLNVTDRFGPFPDMEFFMTSGDFQFVRDLSEDGTTFPVFSSTGSKRFYDLVLPEPILTQFIQTAPPMQYHWSERKNKVMGRYNLMCPEGGASLHLRGAPKQKNCVRADFHELDQSSKNWDGILDVGLTGWVPDHIKSPAKDWVDPAELAKAKYALCLDGATTANRLPMLLKGGQLVMLEGTSPLFAHYYGAMKPWVHYVPVGRDSYDDVFDVARFLVENDDLARTIAERGQAFANKYLVRDASDCYTKKMLEALGALFTYTPRPLPPQAITLRQAIDFVQADIDWRVKVEQNPDAVPDEEQ